MNVYQDTVATKPAQLTFTKKPGLFRRWFMKMSQQAWTDSQQQIMHGMVGVAGPPGAVGPVGSARAGNHPDFRYCDGLTVTVANADGGWIVQRDQYDNIRDKTDRRLYLIHHNEDFGQRLAEIISLEVLRS